MVTDRQTRDITYTKLIMKWLAQISKKVVTYGQAEDVTYTKIIVNFDFGLT